MVYEDTRRAAAGRRLDRTLAALREAGIAAHGFVVDADPVDAVRDALADARAAADGDRRVDAPAEQSGWMRAQRRRPDPQGRPAACPSSTWSSTSTRERGADANVLVVANETVLGEPLLERIRERAPTLAGELPRASRRRATSTPRAAPGGRAAAAAGASPSCAREGIDAHGQIAHPDPYTATMHAVRDERVDEIIVSTFPERALGWLRARPRRPRAPRDQAAGRPRRRRARAGRGGARTAT